MCTKLHVAPHRKQRNPYDWFDGSKISSGIFWIKKVITRNGHIINFPKCTCHKHLIVPLEEKFTVDLGRHVPTLSPFKKNQPLWILQTILCYSSYKNILLSLAFYFLLALAMFYNHRVAIEIKINTDLERYMWQGLLLPLFLNMWIRLFFEYTVFLDYPAGLHLRKQSWKFCDLICVKCFQSFLKLLSCPLRTIALKKREGIRKLLKERNGKQEDWKEGRKEGRKGGVVS